MNTRERKRRRERVWATERENLGIRRGGQKEEEKESERER